MLTVFFDIDQTLWDFEALMRRALARTIAELRRLRPQTEGDLSVESFVADRQQVADDLRGTGTNLEDVRLQAFRASLQRLNISDPELAEQLNTHYFETRFEGVELFPDVLPTFEALSGRYRIGLLSNGNAIPDRLGLDQHVEVGVFASDVGFEKPDHRIFRSAERTLPGDGYVMVGDNLVDDVAGAQEAGWTGVWLNREQAPTHSGVLPDYTAASLAVLPSWLDSRS